MRVSEITLSVACAYLRYEEHYLTTADRTIMQACLDGAKSYVRNYAGLTAEEMEKHENLSIAVLVVTSEMFEKRSATVDNAARTEINRLLEDNLFMHSNNLLG